MEQETLKVEIIPEDFRNAPYGYGAGAGKDGCVLQQALMRMYPDGYVSVGPFNAFVGALPNQKRYEINLKEWGGSKAEFDPDLINELSKKAKNSLEGIPTLSLTLTLS